jgi:hypothetical protein
MSSGDNVIQGTRANSDQDPDAVLAVNSERTTPSHGDSLEENPNVVLFPVPEEFGGHNIPLCNIDGTWYAAGNTVSFAMNEFGPPGWSRIFKPFKNGTGHTTFNFKMSCAGGAPTIVCDANLLKMIMEKSKYPRSKHFYDTVGKVLLKKMESLSISSLLSEGPSFSESITQITYTPPVFRIAAKDHEAVPAVNLDRSTSSHGDATEEESNVALFPVPDEFGGQSIPLCKIDGTWYAAGHIVYFAMNGFVRTSWAKKFKKLKYGTGHTKFNFNVSSNGGAPTIVCDANMLNNIMSESEHARSKLFYETVGKDLLKEMINRSISSGIPIQDLNAVSIIQTTPTPPSIVVSAAEKQERRLERIQESLNQLTSFYVRILLPSVYASANLTSAKQFTLEVIKFGIATSLAKRHQGYGPDNGYMAFSFECKNRHEARIVEDILKYEFISITTLGGLEYIDSAKLATVLGVEYIVGDYASYASLSKALFVYMVRRVKALWPYTGEYGNIHTVIHDTDITKYTFVTSKITTRMAIDLGIVIQPKTTSLQRDLITNHESSKALHEEALALAEKFKNLEAKYGVLLEQSFV